jgi:anaerobic magnesium-protoporphyrin IX monomethyl ester cyclase
MRVAVTYPPLRAPDGVSQATLGQNRQFQWFHNPSYIYPMIPASLATLLSKNGFETAWMDGIAEEWSFEQYIAEMKKFQPDLLFIETKTPTVIQYWGIIGQMKEIFPDCKFVLYGDHVTAMPEESMKNSVVDFILTGGDYDFLGLNIAEHLRDGKELRAGIYYRDQEGKVANTGKFDLVGKLDDLPWIDRDLTKWWMYGEFLYKRTPFTYTLAGRDCPYGKCTFCSWTTIAPRFKVRSPQNLLDEIGFIIEKYGIREIFDDTGTFPIGGYMQEFCEGMIERGYNKKIYFDCNFRFDYFNPKLAALMKSAGFRWMKMGLESANQDTVNRLRKKSEIGLVAEKCRIAKEAGLEVHLTIMVGYPWETKQDALNTVNLAKYLMREGLADTLQGTVVIPYPGTPLYDEAVENGWLTVPPGEWERYGMTEPVLAVPDMKPDEVMKMAHSIYSGVIHPKFIWKVLRDIKSTEDIAYLYRSAKALVGHLFDFKGTRTSTHEAKSN